jgi:endonuclease III-like uncharacterized protein
VTPEQEQWLRAQPWYKEAETAADLDNADRLWDALIPVILAQQAAIQRVETAVHDLRHKDAMRILTALGEP